MSSNALPGLPSPDMVSALLGEAADLPTLAGSAARLRELSLDYLRGHGQVDRALTVALVGATGAGKSTLLNALAGEHLATEGVDRPTSTEPVAYAPEDAAMGEVAALLPRTVRYRVRPEAPWTGQVFIDTPDLNSVERRHQELARGVLEQADVALVVMHKGSVAEAAQVDFLRDFAERRQLAFAVNFADTLQPPAREQLKAQVRTLAASALGLSAQDVPVFAISARAAQRNEDASGEWGAFVAFLQTLAERGTAARVRRSNALGVLRQMRVRVAQGLADVDETLAAVRGALEAGLQAAGPALEGDFRQRLERTEGHLRSEVRRQAALRWWGPAAFWLRLSAWGSGGLTAAAFLARRNLPASLVLAATSTALDAVQSRTRARAAEQAVVADGVSEEGVEALPALARTSVSAARAAALERGIAPEALGLPTAEAWQEVLAQGRAEAWRYTETAAVADAVRGWWRWARVALMPLLNLPLLALFGHVGYRVVQAYVGGHYLTSEYFLNAGALALLLAVGGGALASLSLAGVVRQVRRASEAHFRAALGNWTDALRQRLGEPLLPARGAAVRLLELGVMGLAETSSVLEDPNDSALATGSK